MKLENKIINKRDEDIDIIKGVVIFLMLWGHCIQYLYIDSEFDFFENFVFKFIYSFHMPLFMLISGYLFYFSSKNYSFFDLIHRKIKAMIHPIIGGTIFIFVFVKVLNSIMEGKISILVGGKWLQELGILWFLWSILSSSIVLCFLSKYGKNIYYELVIMFLGVFFVAMFPNPHNNIYMYPYYIIGYYFNKYESKINKLKYAKWIFIFVYPILLIFFDKKHYIYTSGIIGKTYSILDYFVIDLFRWGIGFVGCVFILIILKEIIKIKSLEKLNFLVAKLGKRSLEIYIVSVVFLSVYLPNLIIVLRKIGLNNFIDTLISNTLAYNCILTPALAVLYCTILYYIILLFDKLKINKILFGK